MGKKAKALSDEALQSVKAAMKAARTPAELRRLQCVWLPAALGLSGQETATAVGLGLSDVGRVRGCYRRAGLAGLESSRQRPFAPGSAAALTAALKGARTLDQFQRVQCVLLRVLFGLNGSQVAAAVGWPPGTVTCIQSEYLHRGEAALETPKAGQPLPEGAREILRAAMKHARTVPEFRTALSVYLRAVLGLSLKVVAETVGWWQTSIAKVHHRYLRHGDAALRGPRRGGKRWGLLKTRQESKVLYDLSHGETECGMLMFPKIHRAFEQAAGCPLNAMVVYEILDRHGWSVVALVMRPRQVRRPVGKGRSAEVRRLLGDQEM
ncbi:MAG TPA: hypothetical protein VL523_12020 [Terriglobia bacterium]|nr:hypothetical protein [Terriglobia bacterium]